MFAWKNYLGAGCIIIMSISSAQVVAATVYNESTDDPNGDFYGAISFGSWADSIGVLGAGTTIINGSLAGECQHDLDYNYIDCNPAYGGDTQDSVLIEIASGYRIDSIITSTWNISGPENFYSRFSIKEPSSWLLSGTPIPNGSTSGNMLDSIIGEGIYSFSVSGANSQVGIIGTGPYSMDYSIAINVSAVPVPAAAWLFGSGLIGLAGVARCKKNL